MKFLVVLVAVVAVASAQYAPSGWKPQGARLMLPTEYGPPGAAQTQPQEAQNLEVEITQEHLEFVGQLGETTTAAAAVDETTTEDATTEAATEDAAVATTTELPEDAPEENQDPLTIQQLPERDNSRSFHEQPTRGLLRRIPARFQQQRFARVQEQPQDVYGAPPAPATTTAEPESEPVTEVIVSEAEPEELAEEAEAEVEADDEHVDATIAVANTGAYYVLAPDNTLQRVTFLTRQTEEDRRNNGFTAELRYAPVAPIREPIYAYNEQGQLVQVFNN